jgi:ABC-type antimicrobial peptide transport system permease subunit
MQSRRELRGLFRCFVFFFSFFAFFLAAFFSAFSSFFVSSLLSVDVSWAKDTADNEKVRAVANNSVSSFYMFLNSP